MDVPSRPSIVLLHGANGTAGTMEPLAEQLRSSLDVHAFNMLGHGGRPVPERLTIRDMAADVIAQMDERGLRGTYVFGFSSGGCLALYLARHYPERLLGLCTLAAKYVFDRRTIAHWTHLTDPARLSRPGNKRPAELTKDHHPQDWRDVTSAIRRMFEDFGTNPPLFEDELRAIALPALLFSSDEDQIVPLDETLALGKLLPNSRVVLFKGQCHPFSVVPVAAMGKAMCNWIDELQSRVIVPKTSA